MKLAELGLKTKPATKYFDHGYVKFKTENKELFSRLTIYDKNRNAFEPYPWMIVQSKEELNNLLAIKTVREAIN